VAKEFMVIMLGNKTGLSIEKFFESPFAGKHLKLISMGTKAAAAEAAVTAAEALAQMDRALVRGLLKMTLTFDKGLAQNSLGAGEGLAKKWPAR
jgi:hypothetical protein